MILCTPRPGQAGATTAACSTQREAGEQLEREYPSDERSGDSIGERILRLATLAAIFHAASAGISVRDGAAQTGVKR